MKASPILLAKPLKFLVVDDSRAIQAIIRRAIANCGYEPVDIKTALDGQQALDIIETFVPDLIITDWHMPRVSGLEMVQALRQMGHKTVRVGFVTTEKNTTLLDQAISNGAMFILHKPFNDAELVAAVISSVNDLAVPIAGSATLGAKDVAKAPAPTLLAEGPPTPAPAEPPVDAAAANSSNSSKPAQATVAGKAALTPIPEAAMQQQLQLVLGNIPFKLVANDPMTTAKLTANNLLGLYVGSGVKGVYAIGVMDANAICMVGGGAARKSPPEVRAAMESGQPDQAMLDKANEFLRNLGASLGETAATAGTSVTLGKGSIVKNTFAKLAEVLAQTGRRSDFKVAIPGYGEGRMAFFVMAAAAPA